MQSRTRHSSAGAGLAPAGPTASELRFLEGSFLGAMIRDCWKHLSAVDGYLEEGRAFQSELYRQAYVVGKRLGARGEFANLLEELGLARLCTNGGANQISECLSWSDSLLGKPAIVDAARRIGERSQRRKAEAAGVAFLSAVRNGDDLEETTRGFENSLRSARSASSNHLLQNIVGADQLALKEFPPVRWAVPDIIPEGLTILAGKPKAGKSLLALSLAAMCACGGFALGKVPVDSGPVLYLGLEDPERRLQSRLAKMMGGRDRLPRNLDLVAIGGWARLDQGGLGAIIAWLDSHPDARLVVIDTLAKVRPPRRGGRQGDLYAEDYAVLEGLQELAVRRGVAIIIVHHMRKAMGDDGVDEVSGSAGLTGCADGIATLKRKEEGGELRVIGRDLEQDVELALEHDALTGTWRLAGNLSEVRMSRERRAVTAVLRDGNREGNRLTPSEVAIRLAQNANAIKKLMWMMEKDGQLTKDDKGRYGLPSAASEELGNRGNRGNPGNPGNLGNRTSPAGYPVTAVTDIYTPGEVGTYDDEGNYFFEESDVGF